MSADDAPRASPTLVAVAVVQHAGHVLIGRRAEQAALGGLWEFPGGKVEPGESPAAAAARECLEETGLAIDLLRTLMQCVHDYEHGSVQLFFYDCRPRNPAQEPYPPFLWARTDRLADFEFPPANRDVLALLAAQSDG